MLCAVALLSTLAAASIVRLQREKVEAQRIDRRVQSVQDKVNNLNDLTNQLFNIATAPGVPGSAVQSESARRHARELEKLVDELAREDPRDRRLATLAERTKTFSDTALFVVDNAIPTGPTRDISGMLWKERVDGLRKALVSPLYADVSRVASEEVAYRDGVARRADALAAWGSGGLTAGLVLVLALGMTQAARTRRRAVQESHARGTRRLEALNSNLSDVITVLDRDGGITYQSPSRGAGLHDAEGVQRPLTELVHPDEVGLLHRVVAAPDEITGPIELRVLHADGTYHWWEAQITDLSEEPSVGGLVLTSRDVTERKRAEDAVLRVNEELEERVTERTAELEASVKQLEEFSYTVAHDLRSPLRAINGYSHILLHGGAEELGGEAPPLLEKIMRNTERMGALIDDLLAFSRIGRQAMVRRSVDMGGMVCAVLDDLLDAERQSDPVRQVDVRVGELADTVGDEGMIRQVWSNLLSNALKFTQEREHAWVRVDCEVLPDEPEEVVYHVADNGVGFDMAYADQLFGAFQRLHGTGFPGTGIGLAIVESVVLRHGGRVWADGKEGEGACFSFSLPRSLPRSPRAVGEAENGAPEGDGTQEGTGGG